MEDGSLGLCGGGHCGDTLVSEMKATAVAWVMEARASAEAVTVVAHWLLR